MGSVSCRCKLFAPAPGGLQEIERVKSETCWKFERRNQYAGYAAENVAELRVRIGALSVNPQNPPWGRGAIVFRVASRDVAVAWVANPAYPSFRRETAEDVIVLLQAGSV